MTKYFIRGIDPKGQTFYLRNYRRRRIDFHNFYWESQLGWATMYKTKRYAGARVKDLQKNGAIPENWEVDVMEIR